MIRNIDVFHSCIDHFLVAVFPSFHVFNVDLVTDTLKVSPTKILNSKKLTHINKWIKAHPPASQKRKESSYNIQEREPLLKTQLNQTPIRRVLTETDFSYETTSSNESIESVMNKSYQNQTRSHQEQKKNEKNFTKKQLKKNMKLDLNRALLRKTFESIFPHLEHKVNEHLSIKVNKKKSLYSIGKVGANSQIFSSDLSSSQDEEEIENGFESEIEYNDNKKENGNEKEKQEKRTKATINDQQSLTEEGISKNDLEIGSGFKNGRLYNEKNEKKFTASTSKYFQNEKIISINETISSRIYFKFLLFWLVVAITFFFTWIVPFTRKEHLTSEIIFGCLTLILLFFMKSSAEKILIVTQFRLIKFSIGWISISASEYPYDQINSLFIKSFADASGTLYLRTKSRTFDKAITNVPRVVWENNDLKSLTFEEEKTLLQKSIQEEKLVPGEYWFLISTSWSSKWTKYIEQGSKMLRPNKINNIPLLDWNNQLERTIIENKDYILVHERTWSLFVKIYKGGPPIRRKVIGITGTNLRIVEVNLLELKIHKFLGGELILHFKICISRKYCQSSLFSLISKKTQKSTSKIRLFYLQDQKKAQEIFNTQITLYESNIQDQASLIYEIDEKKGKLQSNDQNGNTKEEPEKVNNKKGNPFHWFGFGETPPKEIGLTGLENFGNTCFMNSSLQCLFNLKSLREYFLNDHYLQEINPNNPHGTGGELVHEFANIYKKYWEGNTDLIKPKKIKSIISEFATQFFGNFQQDSQELISFLLDGLHEDVNRIEKKIFDQNEKVQNGQDLSKLANKTWLNYKKSNDSFFVGKNL
ncbi:ubiquitin carboxyl-terminal hydrolase 11 [Anaeramoeba flamelloides]|uniref:Ubiquitin carboxyl-terminal hydrolase 11 n=1 Tax=Anaeramoeba flamelloides TaxID=1746091 RepID=A0ABQ8XJG5_9EUKA|nr:ubiquitin carboxyl-terminal hydrolase 11 [Anaeramoeba flamelloides]